MIQSLPIKIKPLFNNFQTIYRFYYFYALMHCSSLVVCIISAIRSPEESIGFLQLFATVALLTQEDHCQANLENGFQRTGRVYRLLCYKYILRPFSMYFCDISFAFAEFCNICFKNFSSSELNHAR